MRLLGRPIQLSPAWISLIDRRQLNRRATEWKADRCPGPARWVDEPGGGGAESENAALRLLDAKVELISAKLNQFLATHGAC
jgi:hypothetical protein